MSARVKNMIREFEKLPLPDKRELVAELLRQSTTWDNPPLTDEDLSLTADALFLEMDRAEAADEKPLAK